MLLKMSLREVRPSQATDRCRKSFVYLLNDPSLSDRERLIHLERLREEIEGFIDQFRATVAQGALRESGKAG